MSSANNKMPKSAKTLVVRRQQRGNAISWLYFVPAVFMSIMLNGGLVGVLFLLGSPSKAEAPATEEALNLEREIPIPKADKKEEEKKEQEKKEPESKSPDAFMDPDDPADEGKDLTKIKKPGEMNIPELPKPPEKLVGELPDTPFNPPPLGNGGGFGPATGGTDNSSALSGLSSNPGGGLSSGLGTGLGTPLLPGSFGGRTGDSKDLLLKEGGGTSQSEEAVARGLAWLARVQHGSGKWQLDGPFPDKGQQNDVAGTALGLLPFLASGKTHLPKDNIYHKNVQNGLLFLLNKQDKKTGNFAVGVSGHHQMYTHALATIAMCEAYGLTKDPNLGASAQAGIHYIVKTQHSGGGWRYAQGQPGDTSVVGWMVMALKSGQLAKLDVPDKTMTKAVEYLDNCCTPANEGYGYVGKGSNATMSAVGLLCRQYLQYWGPSNPRMIKGVEMQIKTTPPGAANNMYYYYYATQVMHHFGGQSWELWNVKMREQLIGTQVKTGDQAGSWDSRGDQWGSHGGRLMQTSLSLLTLEVYYRHLPLFHRQKSAD